MPGTESGRVHVAVSGKHQKTRPPGKLRVLILGLVNLLAATLFLLGGSALGFVFVAIGTLYLISWRYEFNGV